MLSHKVMLLLVSKTIPCLHFAILDWAAKGLIFALRLNGKAHIYIPTLTIIKYIAHVQGASYSMM